MAGRRTGAESETPRTARAELIVLNRRYREMSGSPSRVKDHASYSYFRATACTEEPHAQRPPARNHVCSIVIAPLKSASSGAG